MRVASGERDGQDPTIGAFEVTSATGASVRVRKLVLATGMRDEVTQLECIDGLLGDSVHSCPYCHG